MKMLNRWMIEEVRCKVCVRERMIDRVGRRVLKKIEHVERVSGEHLLRGYPSVRWIVECMEAGSALVSLAELK